MIKHLLKLVWNRKRTNALGVSESEVQQEGADTIVYAAAPRPVTLDLASSFATGHGNDTLLSLENALGSRWPDIFRGSELANVFLGGEGGDIIEGTAGDDPKLKARMRDLEDIASRERLSRLLDALQPQQATFIGSVKLTQGETVLQCQRLVIFYDDNAAPAAPKTAAPKAAVPKAAAAKPVARGSGKGVVVVVPSLSEGDRREPGEVAGLIAGGAELRAFPQPVMEACYNATQEHLNEIAEKSALFKKTKESHDAYMKEVLFYTQVGENYYDNFLLSKMRKG